LRARQRQELRDHARGALDARADPLKARAQVGRVALAQCKLELRAQSGERRAHLVGRVGNEALLGAHARREPLHHAVERLNEGCHFLGHLAHVDR